MKVRLEQDRVMVPFFQVGRIDKLISISPIDVTKKAVQKNLSSLFIYRIALVVIPYHHRNHLS
jgi:hypothetical protein